MFPVYSPAANPTPSEAVVPVLEQSDASRNSGANASDEPHEHVTLSRRGVALRPVWQGRVLLTLNQLAVMTKNGIEIAEALENVASNCQCPRLAASLRAIHESVRGGQSLSAAVATHGTYFPRTLAPMLAAAEAAGDVPETIDRVCKRMRGELRMRGTIAGAMIYPVILIAASSIVLSALILGVLPQFSRVFASMGQPVPAYTQALLDLGDFCRAYWYVLVPGLMLTGVAVVLSRNAAFVRKPLSRFLMYGPLVRSAYRPLQAGRVLRTLASMVQGGVPLLQAVQLARGTTRDAYWRRLLDEIESNLVDGLPASSAMSHADFLPNETAQLMATAERTGRMAEVLEDIGAFYEEEAERRIKRLVVMLEPAIIVVMGVLVAGIVMSVVLPLLDLSTVRS